MHLGDQSCSGRPVKVPLVAWKPYRASSSLASFRYRCVMPMLGLAKLGWKSILLQEGESLVDERIAAMVFVKSFSNSDLALARRLRAKGVVIILDLCDNIFVPNYAATARTSPVGRFDEMAELAACVITPTEELARRVRDRLNGRTRVLVIPDQIETKASTEALSSSAAALLFGRDQVCPRLISAILPGFVLRYAFPPIRRFARTIDRHAILARLARVITRLPLQTSFAVAAPKQAASIVWARLTRPRRVVQRAPLRGVVTASPDDVSESEASELGIRRRRVIWFGNHGAPYSSFGMGTINLVRPALTELNREIPLELLIVSNNRQMYEELVKDFSFPTRYKEWGMLSIFEDVAGSDVCILPNARDEFSACKSPNRALLALGVGIPVVASSLASLEPLRNCIVIDDWYGGIKAYLTDDERRARDLAAAKDLIAAHYSAETIARQWHSLLGEVTGIGDDRTRDYMASRQAKGAIA